MMRSLSKHFYSCLAIIALCLAFSNRASAQMENDGIMIPKNYLCPGIMYSTSDWSKYWEGTFKRDNGNLGTVNTKVYSLMVTYGVTNNLIATIAAPYVTTNASEGTLKGESALQDVSLNLKWKALKIKTGRSEFALFASVTGSIPLTNYQSDYLPLAVGSHSKNISGRLLVDYRLGKFFATASGAYINRSNITIDRNSYENYDQLIYSDQVKLPNMNNFNFRTGYRSRLFIGEILLDKTTSLGGFDIRKNAPPFPSNRMNFTAAGVNFRFRLKSFYALELTAGDEYVIKGRNVGQTNMIHGGLSYIIGLSKTKVNNNKANFNKD